MVVHRLLIRAGLILREMQIIPWLVVLNSPEQMEATVTTGELSGGADSSTSNHAPRLPRSYPEQQANSTISQALLIA